MVAPQPTRGSTRNLIIGVVIAVVLCCCCVLTAAGGYAAYQAYQTANTAREALQDFEIPVDPSNPEQPDIPIPGIPDFGTGGFPAGGLADEVTRATAWGTLLFTATLSGCDTPTAPGTVIEVIQEPDAGGVWVERWQVDCGDGSSQAFKLTFTPQNGFTTVDVAPE